MNPHHELLLNKILDAPVGQVVAVLGEVLNCNIHLQVVEQNTVAPNEFVRKVTITAQDLPIITANVKFNSNTLPEFIMEDLLKKKRGVGTILNVNGITATRNVLSLNRDVNKSTATREYELVHDGVVWFTILEEIRLSNLDSNKHS